MTIAIIWEGDLRDGRTIRLIRNTAMDCVAFAIRNSGKWDVYPFSKKADAKLQLLGLSQYIQDYYQDKEMEAETALQRALRLSRENAVYGSFEEARR